jgi:hydroxymethylpyrimidine pyrophosphatase-like HAD family hydrolase
MGQAPDSVRAAADHVTASNLPGEDGAAKALERFVLERADS